MYGGIKVERLVEFRYILINASELSWKDSLFLPKDEVWTLNTKCAVLNTDDLEEDEEEPQFASENNLIYALNIHTVQDIVNNAWEQRSNCLEEDLLKAFLYYYDNDAFITFDEV